MCIIQQYSVSKLVPEKWCTKNDNINTDAESADIELDTSPARNTSFFWHLLNEMITDVDGVYRGILKILCSKRISESAPSRPQIYNIIDQLSQIMISSLKVENYTNPLESQQLITKGLGFVQSMLTDERNTITIQTFQLISFQKVGGLDLIFSILKKSIELFTKFSNESETSDLEPDEHKSYIRSLKYTMELVVDICQSITNNKYFLESPQTANWQLMYRDKTKPDYYDSHKHLVELRYKILQNLITVWQFDLLYSLSNRLIANLTKTFIQILKADGEQAGSEPSNSSGIYMPTLTSAIFGRSLVPPAPVVADPSRVDNLHDMGFPRAAAEVALIRFHNNVALAADYLLSNPAAHFATRPEPSALPPATTENTQTASLPVAPSETETAGIFDGGAGNVGSERGELMEIDEESASSSKEIDGSHSGTAATEKVDEKKTDYAVLLNELRQELKSTVTSRVVEIMDSLDSSLIFSIKDLMCLVGENYLKSSLMSIADSIQTLVDNLLANIISKDSKPLSFRLHLAVLLINDNSISTDVSEMLDSIVKSISKILEISKNSDEIKKQSWLSSVILIMESYFSRLLQPADAAERFNDSPEACSSISVAPSPPYLIDPAQVVEVGFFINFRF